MSAAPPDRARLEILLADANVLIDLLNANALGLVGDLIRHDLAAVYLPRIVYDEVSTVITESQIAQMRELNWLDTCGNIVLAGPPGLGKTMIAVGLGWMQSRPDTLSASKRWET